MWMCVCVISPKLPPRSTNLGLLHDRGRNRIARSWSHISWSWKCCRGVCLCEIAHGFFWYRHRRLLSWSLWMCMCVIDYLRFWSRFSKGSLTRRWLHAAWKYSVSRRARETTFSNGQARRYQGLTFSIQGFGFGIYFHHAEWGHNSRTIKRGCGPLPLSHIGVTDDYVAVRMCEPSFRTPPYRRV